MGEGIGLAALQELIVLVTQSGKIHFQGHADAVAAHLGKKSGIVRGHGASQGQKAFTLRRGRGRESQGQTAGSHGGRQTIRLAGHQNKQTVFGRVFQCFQQGIGGADRETVGIVYHADFAQAQQGTVDHVAFNFPHLVNFDLRVGFLSLRFNDQEIGMGGGRDEFAGAAVSTRVRLCRRRNRVAGKGLCKSQRRQAFADTVIAPKEVGMANGLVRKRGPDLPFRFFLTDDVCKWHMCVEVVTGV